MYTQRKNSCVIRLLRCAVPFLCLVAWMSKTAYGDTTVIIPPGADDRNCQVKGTCYSPLHVTIQVGETVTWSNHNDRAHNVASGIPGDPDGMFDSGLILASQAFSHTFLAPGTFSYHDMTAPWMEGLVTVQDIDVGTVLIALGAKDDLDCAENGSCYTPMILTNNVGDTVTWSNQNDSFHNITSGIGSPDGMFDSGLISPEDTYSHTFLEPGTFPYFDALFPWMSGRIEVRTDARVEIRFGSSTPGCEDSGGCFKPESITIQPGDTVTWKNQDDEPHTISSGEPGDPRGIFDSMEFEEGAFFSHTFEDIGVFPYFCPLHPWMQGTVVVVDSSQPDDFEPNNTSTTATFYINPQVHTFHEQTDVDWVKFYATSNLIYEIETVHLGTNLDTTISVFFEEPDGNLTFVDKVDAFGLGFDNGERLILEPLRNGIYLFELTHNPDSSVGSFLFSSKAVDCKVPGITVNIYEHDHIGITLQPVAKELVLHGKTNVVVAMQGLSEINITDPRIITDITSIRVHPKPGYEPLQDSQTPDRLETPTDQVFGNPRESRVGCHNFSFVQVATAIGSVHDAWTHEPVEAADIRFNITANASELIRRTFNASNSATNYPPYRWNRAPQWKTDRAGQFPPDVKLININYTAVITKPNYHNATTQIVRGVPGHQHDLTIQLVPIDNDNDGMADEWEKSTFGDTNEVATTDYDGDGANNRSEYLTGTDPTSSNDVFKLLRVHLLPNEHIELSWPGLRRRGYSVHQLTQSMEHGTSSWTSTRIAGPFATSDVSLITWSNPLSSGPSNALYRLEQPAP